MNSEHKTREVHEMALTYASAVFSDDLRKGQVHKIDGEPQEIVKLEHFAKLYENAYSYFCALNNLPDPYDKED